MSGSWTVITWLFERIKSYRGMSLQGDPHVLFYYPLVFSSTFVGSPGDPPLLRPLESVLHVPVVKKKLMQTL